MGYAVKQNLIRDRLGSIVAMNHYLEPASQRPQQFQDGNIERHAGRGQPHSPWRILPVSDRGFACAHGALAPTKHAIDARKKIQDVAMLDHYALGLSG